MSSRWSRTQSISSRAPSATAAASSAATTSAAVTVPSSRPSSSTTTPRPLGDDSAASSTARDEPSSRATVPPRCRSSRSTGAVSRSGSTQPSGRRRRRSTRTQSAADAGVPPRPAAPSRTVGSSCGLQRRRSPEAEAAVAAVAADEVGHEVVVRVAEQRGRVRDLGELAAHPQHRDLVAELDRLVDVVGDEQDRLAELGLQPEELVLQLLADDRVDRAERLVHQHHRRVGGERPGHADALLLAAGELVRVAAGELRGQADPLEQLEAAARAPSAGPSRAAAAPSRCCRRPCGAGRARRAG